MPSLIAAGTLQRVGRFRGMLHGQAQPPLQGLEQSQVPETVGPLVRVCRSAGRNTRSVGGGRRVKIPGPERDGAAGREHLNVKLLMAGTHALRQLPE